MGRWALPAAMLALVCVIVGGTALAAAPAGGGAEQSSGKAKKCKKKKKKKSHGLKHKRCKKRGKPGGGMNGGAPTTPAPGRLLVTEREYSLQLSRPSVTAGATIVDQYNHGEDSHDLRFAKVADSTLYSFDELGSGLTARKTLTLTAGTWKLFCSLPDHESLGMQAFLTVN
jgi:plastocyanin